MHQNQNDPITRADLAALVALLPRPIPWAEFLATCWPSLSYPVVQKSHAWRIARVIGEIAEMDPPPATTADLTVDFVRRYVMTRPEHWSPWTLKGHVQIIQRLCRMASERRCLAVNPFAEVPMKKWVRTPRPGGKRHLTREEIGRLLALLQSDVQTRKGWHQWKARRLYVVACLGIYCGLRRNELLMLHVADIDLPARVIWLEPHAHRAIRARFKSDGCAKPVGIPEALVPILDDWLAHRLDHPRGFTLPDDIRWLIPTCDRMAPWIGGGKSRAVVRLQAVARRAGIPHVTLHMLRRSLATHLEGHGLGSAMISRILRHSGQAVTETFYRQADVQQVVDAVKDLVF